MNNKPVLIIGAGISGLALCLVLIKNGYPAILFEKEKEIDQPGAGINIMILKWNLKKKIVKIS